MSSRTKTSTDKAGYEPICAVATPASVRSALAVIRASGGKSLSGDIFSLLGKSFLTTRGAAATELSPRVTHYGVISDNEGEIDDVLFVKFANGASFTGEDSFEISCHGNPLIIRRILALLYKLGFRPAQAGEFTRRAYLNGKLALDAAQAVAEIIEARSHASLRAAKRLAHGSFRTEMLVLRSKLMNLLADLNAELDFIDEDLTFASRETKLKLLNECEVAARQLESAAARFDNIKEGVRIAIVGVPNAGKSSLMNRLLGQNRAIVSDIAGTTRDYIEAELEIAGVNIRLFDTAGLREDSGDSIEALGMERTRELVSRAHVCVLLIDGSESPDSAATLATLGIETAAECLTVLNKADQLHAGWSDTQPQNTPLRISAATGAGMEDFLSVVAKIITQLTPEDALPLSAWQRQLLLEIADHLARAKADLGAGELPEVITHTVQAAVDRIAELTGDITSEDILGRIFSRFCIGK